MKILYITAGAAGMYCGSCLRDNALAAELMSQGHEATLLPIYTPTRTDEPNVSQRRVFFGGISVYLQQRLALFRKTPWLLDRFWDSRLVLQAAARHWVRTDPRLLGELTLSVLKGEEGFQGKELRKLLHWLKTQSPPDVVNLPNSLLIGLARPLKKALGCPVCCTLQGENAFLEGLAEPYRSAALDLIRANVEFVDAFLPVSDYSAEFMSRYLGIPDDKIQVVPLGINLKGYAASRSRSSACFTVGYFARIIPEKGLHLLCDSYRRLRQRNSSPPARLEVAGYLGPEHREYLRGIERQMEEWGFAGEFRYRGTLDRDAKIRFLQNLDVLCVPSTYNEHKGIYLLEAMANGVPVVQPRRGAFPEIIAKTSGGLLVEPDDCGRLAEGILSIWKDPAWAEELGRNGSEGVRAHYSVAGMASRALEVYTGLQEALKQSQQRTTVAG